MSWQLKPINPSPDAPVDEESRQPQQGGYTMMGWFMLIRLLKKWQVDVTEFADDNSGRVISDGTCKKVADAIEEHLPELDERFQNWLAEDIALWRTCGGYEQW